MPRPLGRRKRPVETPEVARCAREARQAMRRVVFITQQADPAHPALAATVPKIAALARRVDEVAVLAGGAAPGALPGNCRLRRFAARTQAERGARFTAALTAELARGRPTAVVAHMCPIYAILAAPLVRPLGVPLVLWFTHWRATDKLRLATRVSSAVTSVDTRSFPLRSAKLVPIGHGIDLDEFRCRGHERTGDGLRAVALGRYTPVKGYDVVLRAARVAADRGLALRVRICGPVLTSEERRHRDELERLHERLRLHDLVALEGPVPRADVPRLLADSDVLVNNTRSGGADKVVFEAGASCLPPIASAPVFDGLLPGDLRFRADDPAGLAETLIRFARLDAAARAAIGRRLREQVAVEHSVDSWADRLLNVASGR
jgi:glycosyltransferase involved in cell wall biosynthesis